MPEEQLPFDLSVRAAYRREDFFVSTCNAEAVAWLDRWPHWPGPLLVIEGPAGSGKTHLCHVFQERLRGNALIWDGVDTQLAAPDGPAVAQDIFHAYTRAPETGHPVLLTASLPPAFWPWSLPDLRSRVMAAPLARLGAPDDRLITVVMAKMFADRQIFVGQDVLAYLVRRVERSFTALGDVVAALDRRALADKRPVTVPLARAVLESLMSERSGE